MHPLGDELPGRSARSAARRAPGQRLLVLFLGSTIGNFEPEAAIEFVGSVRADLDPGDALLLGTDLVKPTAQLLDAYDDPTGVTAAFNLNLLGRINRELAGRFRLTPVRPRDPLPRRGAAHRDAPAFARLPDRQHTQGRPDRGFRRRGNHLHRRRATSSTWSRWKRWPAPPDSWWNQWVDEEWGFAENLLAAPRTSIPARPAAVPRTGCPACNRMARANVVQSCVSGDSSWLPRPAPDFLRTNPTGRT